MKFSLAVGIYIAVSVNDLSLIQSDYCYVFQAVLYLFSSSFAYA